MKSSSFARHASVVGLCFLLFASAILSQECSTDSKPKIYSLRFVQSPEFSVLLNGSYHGDQAMCRWYADGSLNSTEPAKNISSSLITCAIPNFLIELQNRGDDNGDDGNTTDLPFSPTPTADVGSGEEPADEDSGLTIDFSLEIQLNVYDNSTTNRSNTNCLTGLKHVAGPKDVPTVVEPTEAYDCGFGFCLGNFSAASSASGGNLSRLCVAYREYSNCLNALHNCSASDQSDIDRAKANNTESLATCDLLEHTTSASPSANATANGTESTSMGPSTLGPSTSSVGPSTVIPSTEAPSTLGPSTAMPSTGGPASTPPPPASEIELWRCCTQARQLSSVGADCRRLCGQVFDQPSVNRNLLQSMERTCRNDGEFISCLESQASLTFRERFLFDFRDCCDDSWGSIDCQHSCKNFTDGSISGSDLVNKCFKKESYSIVRCFVDLVEAHYGIKPLTEECCEQSDDACKSQCKTITDNFWSTHVLSVREPGSGLDSEMEVVKYHLLAVCDDGTCLSDDDDGGDGGGGGGEGSAEEAIMMSMSFCCNESIASGKSCQDVCTNLMSSNLSSDSEMASINPLNCFRLEETKMLMCISDRSGMTLTDIRSLFRGLSQDSYIGQDIMDCCKHAVGSSCENSCIEAMNSSLPFSSSWLACKRDLSQIQMLQCLSSVEYGICAGGCDQLDFCSDFNNRPYEYRLAGGLCGLSVESLAAALHAKWLADKSMSINGQVIKLKSIDSCEAKYFKSLACFLFAQPCQDVNDLSLLCQTECVSVLNKCKAADEGRTSLAICQMIGSTSVYNQCWNLSAFSTPPAGGVKEINVSVALVLRGVPWTPLLQFDASPIFRNLSRNVEFNIEKLFVNLRGKQSVTINAFRLMANGFIEVNFTVTSRGVQPASYDEVKEVLERYVGGQSDSQLGNLVVAGNSLLLEDRTDYSGAPKEAASLVFVVFCVFLSMYALQFWR
ncbi:uncharacterized protein [Oscarella lobularis]|uniref:uncharacterized protein n=1 Tax=Oscarella lobularis TaxID=121494 RepID=UPI003313BB7F